MGLKELKNALGCLRNAVRAYEAYERPLRKWQCEDAGQALSDVLANWPDISADKASESVVEFASVNEKGMEIRLKNTAYIPHCQSQALTYLKKRRQLAEAFGEVLKEADRMIALVDVDEPCSPSSDPIDFVRERYQRKGQTHQGNLPLAAQQDQNPFSSSHRASSHLLLEAKAPVPPAPPVRPTPCCSVCNRPANRVRFLIKDKNIYLCDGCLEVCNEILHEDGVATDAPAPEQKRPFSKQRYYCSFCGKEYQEVARLISMTGKLFICNYCVGVCNKCVAEADRSQEAGAATVEEFPSQLENGEASERVPAGN